jgi:hypothetical protein
MIDEWYVIGLAESKSKQDLIDVTLEITLFDANGDPIESQSILAPMVHLGPGEETPFQASFAGVATAASARTEIISFNTKTFERIEVIVEILSSASIEGGREMILGQLSNENSVDVELSWFGILLTDRDGQPLRLITEIYYPRVLAPNQSIPFIALVDASTITFEPLAFIDGIVSNQPSQHMLTISVPPELFLTDQGLLVVLSGIKNEDIFPRWLETFAVLRLDGEVISMIPMRSSIPLQPGKTRFLSIDQFPGIQQLMAQRNLDFDALSAEIILSPSSSRRAEGTVVPLEIEVTHYEPVGSSLILRGIVTNKWTNQVENATVYVALYSTEGTILTSAEILVGYAIAQDEQVSFVLPVHLPQGMTPAMSEYDLQAAGIIP